MMLAGTVHSGSAFTVLEPCQPGQQATSVCRAIAETQALRESFARMRPTAYNREWGGAVQDYCQPFQQVRCLLGGMVIDAKLGLLSKEIPCSFFQNCAVMVVFAHLLFANL